jgi:hypothetical protein
MQFPMAGAHKLDDLLGESGRDFTHNLNGLWIPLTETLWRVSIIKSSRFWVVLCNIS